MRWRAISSVVHEHPFAFHFTEPYSAVCSVLLLCRLVYARWPDLDAELDFQRMRIIFLQLARSLSKHISVSRSQMIRDRSLKKHIGIGSTEKVETFEFCVCDEV